MSPARVLEPSRSDFSSLIGFAASLASPLVVAAFTLIATPMSLAADRIALRDAKVIADRSVVGFDEDGVRLDGAKAPRLLGWDEIESARVAQRDQARFDKMLKDLGEPLFRLRRRLKTGDSRDYGPFAETLHPRFVGRRSPTAQMVSLAAMRARLASGRRESALEPYLRCLELVRSGIAAPESAVAPLRCNPVNGFSPELPAVWFDAQAAKAALPGARKAIEGMTKPVPEGVFVYAAALACAAGDEASADFWIQSIRSDDRAVRVGLKIVQAQREAMTGRPGAAIQSLTAELDLIPDVEKPAACYWIGRSLAARSDNRERLQGVLMLLRLPAQHGEQAPDLAAAGLHEAAAVLEASGDAPGAASLRNELLVHYGASYHAARLDPQRKSLTPPTPKPSPDSPPKPSPASASPPQRKG